MDSIINLDEHIFLFINKTLSSDVLDAFLIPIRHKLFWIPLYLFIVFFVSLNFKREKWLIYACFGLTILFSDTISSKVIKKSVERARPCHVQRLESNIKVPCSYGFSFTSSHATNHFAIGTFLFFFFSFWKRRWLWLLWAGMISFAQVYVGVHYPFDVLAGGIIGVLIGFLTFELYKYILQFYKIKYSDVV